MHFTGRSVFGTLVFVGGLIALNNGPDRVHPWSGVAVAASNTVNAGGTSEDGEIWVTAQNTHELKILLGMGGIETVVLPAGTAPHTISFSPDGSYAYVSNIGNGDLIVVRADDRQIVATLDFGPTFTHATKASPDGTVLLSANPTTGILTKIAADEQAETWTPVASLNLAARRPGAGRCASFSARTASARMRRSSEPAGGIAIVDVPTMTLVGTLPTAGSVSGCGLVNSNDGRTIFLTLGRRHGSLLSTRHLDRHALRGHELRIDWFRPSWARRHRQRKDRLHHGAGRGRRNQSSESQWNRREHDPDRSQAWHGGST